ncbi:hypothetical protein PMAYCL1PPCAC_09448, partial [Pristionchus mayeri]
VPLPLPLHCLNGYNIHIFEDVSEQLQKSRVDPKIVCNSCQMNFSPANVRMCTKEGCSMLNQLICLACALDGDHGGHVVKYDVMLEKIRWKLRDEVNIICSKVEDKKQSVTEKTNQLTKLFDEINKNLSKAQMLMLSSNWRTFLQSRKRRSTRK